MKKTMKVMAMLLCAVTMVLMSGCSKESTYERRIVGKWEVVRTDYCGGCEIPPWVFNSDGRCSVWVEEEDDPGLINTSYYFVNGNTLMIQYYVLTIPWEIQELSNTTMILRTNSIKKDEEWTQYEFKKIR